MLKTLLVFLVAIPTIASANIIREIGGVQYNLHDDFDTADGECVLRGKEYAGFFYSSGAGSLPVVKLNSDGSVKQILKNDVSTEGSFPVIGGIGCQ
jgi:hypothetical protein